MSRKLLATAAAVVVIVGAAGGLVLAWRSTADRPAASPALPPARAEVTRTTLVETKTVSGTLGYGDTTPISAVGTGTFTWIAPVGSTVERGEPLFRIDERPVVALYGSVPMYRTLRVGAGAAGIQGTDVLQLKENLAALGYTGFGVDLTYTAATAEAVQTWQTDLGLPANGTIELGQVVFTPGPVRIAGHAAHVGDGLGERGMPVLNYTGTTKLVSVELDVADQALAAQGRKVTVTVPRREPVDGTIGKVGTVITVLEEPGAAQGGTSSAASGARIRVTVTIADQDALGSLDAAPVDVDFVSQERKEVLTVPVAALLALADGGFGLEVIDADTTRIVPVKTGMFATGRVEVSGEGIAEGIQVGVPE
jgi:peptidoglycan hydrolase-like protein with peptidoglycan-binding domain